MLVAAGLVTGAQLDEALAAQQASGMRLGKQLVSLGYVSEVQLTQLLSHQLSVPWVSLERVEFSADLLARVPAEVADRFCVMPIYVRSVRHQGATLYVAMDDPTHEEALGRVSMASGLPVKPMIAPPSDLRRAVEEHYFGARVSAREGEGELAQQPLEQRRNPPKASNDQARSPRGKPPPPPKLIPQGATKPEPVVSVDEYDTPSSPPTSKNKTLTLLDGTQVALPGGGGKLASQELSEVRHAIKAVRAAAANLGIEGAPRWHDIVQALIDAMAARGIKLARKEVAEAWARRKQPAKSE